ncbi:vasopressin V1a receptor-like [Ixodes scapularis]
MGWASFESREAVFGSWVLGGVACKVIVYLQIVTLASTTFILTSMSYDRYMAICKPLESRSGLRRARCMVAASWAMAFVFATPQLFIFLQVQTGVTASGLPHLECLSVGYTHHWQRQLYFSWLTLYILVVPGLLISAFYLSLLRAVWAASDAVAATPAKDSGSVESTLRRCTQAQPLLSRARAKTLKLSGAPVKAGVWRVASPRTPSHAGSPAHVWLCVAFPCPGKRASWWLSRARGRFGPFGAPRAKKLHSEDLLVEVNTKKQSEALLRLTNIVDVEVSVSPHRTLNTVRGVLSEEAFLYTSEDELLEGLKSSGVVDVRRIVFRKNGENIPSKHVILTFERRALPETVKAGYLNCRIRPYIPNPQRCFRCQRFGHGSRSCRGKETCAKCGNEGHVSDGCEAEAHCANCRGPHPAYYRSCPLWKQEKDILAIKVKENLSYADAKKRFSFLSKGGYAEVVRRGPAPRSETKATQVSPEILVADLKAPSPQQRQHAAPLGKDGPAIAVPALPFKTIDCASCGSIALWYAPD